MVEYLYKNDIGLFSDDELKRVTPKYGRLILVTKAMDRVVDWHQIILDETLIDPDVVTFIEAHAGEKIKPFEQIYRFTKSPHVEISEPLVIKLRRGNYIVAPLWEEIHHNVKAWKMLGSKGGTP
jgi:hypothetical protein